MKKYILDLKKELGFKDEYFEKKVNYLLGYTSELDKSLSENSILDFHLAFQTNPNLDYEPKETTDKIIWKYLASNNLLDSFQEIDISELDKSQNLKKLHMIKIILKKIYLSYTRDFNLI